MTNSSGSYEHRREQLKEYFDRTAVKAWERLTTDAPVSGIRQTVREGRDRMRALLLSWLPEDLTGKRLLDAGCGTGALSIEAAQRGAEVVGIDISPTLVDIAKQRTPEELQSQIRFQAGDMLAAEAKSFDYVVAMDSIIHYEPLDMAQAIASLQERTIDSQSRVLFTFAPRTPALMLMKAAGKWFPRNDRSPAIEPIREKDLREFFASLPALAGTEVCNTEQVLTPFYKSQAMEIRRP